MQDKSLQNKMKEASDAKELVVIATQMGKEHGYVFREEDIEKVAFEDVDVELNDDMLLAVAGGKLSTPSPVLFWEA